MAKKKPDPAAVAQRKQERVAFVQANPNLAPEQARQQFYVKTRTEELSAAGKSVDKQALRDKFQSGQVSREGFYTPGDIARFNTSGSNNGGSLADSKADTVTSPTSLTTPTGVKMPAAGYMAPKATTALGLEVAPTTTVLSSSATIPVTDTPSKTVLKTGNISGPNVRMGIKQAQPTKVVETKPKESEGARIAKGLGWIVNSASGVVNSSLESMQATFINPAVNLVGNQLGKNPNLREAGPLEATINTADALATIGSLGGNQIIKRVATPVINKVADSAFGNAVKTTERTIVPKVKSTITKMQNKRRGYEPKIAPWADNTASSETFYRTPLGDLKSSNAPLGEIRAPKFERMPETVEPPKPLTSADRMENAAAVVAKNSEIKPPVAQAVDPNPSLHATKQAELQAAVPETNTIEVVTPTVKPPRASTRKPKVKTTPVAETPKPIIETSSGATAPRDFAAELKTKADTNDFDWDDDLQAWSVENADAANSILDNAGYGSGGGKTNLNDLSGISGQRVSRSDLFDGNRFGRKSPMDRGMFIEDAGAPAQVGNLNPTPAPAANMREYKGIKYTVDPNNPMIGIQEGTGVQFTLRRTKSGKPGTPHTSGVDVATGLPKLRTPRTKFADDVERKASEKTAEQARTAATSAKRAEGAVTTEQVVKAAQEKADAGATKTLGEFSVAPKLRGKKLQQYNRDVASGKIKIDVDTGKTKGTYEPSIASQEPFVYSSKAVTQDPVIGQGSMPNKSVTSLGTTKAPVKPMDSETFKKLSNDMVNRANNPLRDITNTSRVAKEQYNEIVAVYGQESADKLVKSAEMRQIVSGQQKFGSELTEGLGASAKANNTQGTLESASAYVEWFKSPEAQKMLIDDPARYYRIVGNKQNIAAMEVVGKANEVNAGTTAPRSMRQANNDVNSSLAEHQTALREARTKEEVVFGINADTPTPAAVDANFTDAGYADSAFAKEEAEIVRGIAWADSQPSQPIRDTAWERSYSAKKTASADAAETIANGSDDEVLALAKKYEIPVSGKTPANVVQLRKDLARKLSKSDSGPGRTGSRPTRADGVPPPVKPLKNDLVAQGLNKAQIKEAYNVHRKAYQDWADEAVFDENPFTGRLRNVEAYAPQQKNVAKEYTTVHPDGTPEPQLTPPVDRLDPDKLRAKIAEGKGYTKENMDADLAANAKLRADTDAIRAIEVEAKIKWHDEATTTGNVKAYREDRTVEELNQYFGDQRNLLVNDPEKYHAIRQGIEERRIARHIKDISTPEGEAARAGAAKENARMEAHRAELKMPAIQPDRNVLQQQDWVAEVSRRFFGSTKAPAPTIPVARTPRSAMPEVSVADWETSVNQRFNNPLGGTPRLRRPGAPNRPFEAGEDTLGDLSMITGQKHGLELEAEALGMSGPVNDWSVAQARSSAQKGTSALSNNVDNVEISIQGMRTELGELAGRLSQAKTLKTQREITRKMREIEAQIDAKESAKIFEGEKDNFEFDLGLD
ncbi:hypothetical protein uvFWCGRAMDCOMC429_026 [Freshwater phage uvFW-CGR-AMD-COM-C429]|nr:hypothetical protein uvFWCGRAMDCOMC429_026 [Freshwater phage uvFW-CGR-AMD-COM-C429]